MYSFFSSVSDNSKPVSLYPCLCTFAQNYLSCRATSLLVWNQNCSVSSGSWDVYQLQQRKKMQQKRSERCPTVSSEIVTQYFAWQGPFNGAYTNWPVMSVSLTASSSCNEFSCQILMPKSVSLSCERCQSGSNWRDYWTHQSDHGITGGSATFLNRRIITKLASNGGRSLCGMLTDNMYDICAAWRPLT